MFLDVIQKEEHIEVSYFNKKGGISLVALPLPPEGYTNWQITHEHDPYKDPKFRNHDGKPIKRVPGKRFYDLNLNEFLIHRISDEHKHLLHDHNKLNFFSVDIETEIKEEMPTPEKAHLYQILSISITAPNLTTIVLSTKEVDEAAVNAKVQEGLKILDFERLGFLDFKPEFLVKHFYFEDEKTMIEFFLQKVNEVFHVFGGWNFHGYDWPFIKNRCAHLNISIEKICSPAGHVTYDGWPLHRLVLDYMALYAKFSKKGYLTSLSLDNISSIELGATKLKFPMTLKELFHQDYVTFIAYAAIDTILVQLIHLKCNSINILMNMAYYNKISVRKADGPIAQTDALMFEEFYENDRIMADPPKDGVKRDYPGAFVKEPVRKECSFPSGYDAKSLYPTTKKTYNISPELYMGKCRPEQVAAIRERGDVVTDRLSVYDQSKGPGMFKRLQTKLSDARTLFKQCELTIWSKYTKKLEEEAARRGLKIK